MFSSLPTGVITRGRKAVSADDIGKNKKPSDRLVTLLVAYTLCKEAIDHNRVLKDYVTESMFYTGIIAYYSIFKTAGDKKWLEDTLLARNLPLGATLHIRPPSSVRADKDIGHYYLDVFKKFETIRDKNIAHKDPERSPEDKLEWLQIPSGVAGSDVFKGTLYMTHYVFLSLDGNDKREFLDLVHASIDILWQKEGLPIHRCGPDGNVYYEKRPKLNYWDD